MDGRKINAIIFDMDGVLVNTEPHHVAIERNLFEMLQLKIDREEHYSYLGKSTSQMWNEISRKHKTDQSGKELAEKNSAEIIRYFSLLEKIEVMPGIRDLLERINQNKIPLALASSSERLIIELILSRTGLKKYFSYTISCEAIGKAKPEPDIYLHTARLLSVAPEECLVVEDSPNGIRAAKSANMICVAYTNDPSVSQDLADESINDFSLMPEILKKYGIDLID